MVVDIQNRRPQWKRLGWLDDRLLQNLTVNHVDWNLVVGLLDVLEKDHGDWAFGPVGWRSDSGIPISRERFEELNLRFGPY